MHRNILALRHAESHYNVHATKHQNSDLTQYGEYQAHLTSNHMKSLDLRGYTGYTSPMLRCLRTARYIQRTTGMHFTVLPELCEVSWEFPENGLDIRVMSDVYWEMNWHDLADHETINLPKETDTAFVEKLSVLFNNLPEKSLVVTHGTGVMTLIELAISAKVDKVPEWDGSIKNASLTSLSGNALQYLSQVVY